jgi:hypothetical protein
MHSYVQETSNKFAACAMFVEIMAVGIATSTGAVQL